ncbi:hypothetical protein AAFF_G00299150 [Aldrovandia affinis]|uniref:Uncharacterized protein n=1 Tax=Aldrovandia affinis TaxID=143900 RepID=A0AAD7R9B0_9TELE|nr:hypothetical protein AAFF_G00299150 [Aldrovandia affinis]
MCDPSSSTDAQTLLLAMLQRMKVNPSSSSSSSSSSPADTAQAPRGGLWSPRRQAAGGEGDGGVCLKRARAEPDGARAWERPPLQGRRNRPRSSHNANGVLKTRPLTLWVRPRPAPGVRTAPAPRRGPVRGGARRPGGTGKGGGALGFGGTPCGRLLGGVREPLPVPNRKGSARGQRSLQHGHGELPPFTRTSQTRTALVPVPAQGLRKGAPLNIP